MVVRVLSHRQQDLSIGCGDQRLPEGVEGLRGLDGLLLHLFSVVGVVEQNTLVDGSLDVDLQESLAVLHGSRVPAAQVNPDLIGIDGGMDLFHPPKRKRKRDPRQSEVVADEFVNLLVPYSQSSITLRLCRFCYLWFLEVGAVCLGCVALEYLGR